MRWQPRRLAEQAKALGIKPDVIVIPSSSGGTHAGLVAGAWALGWDVAILGISIDEPAAHLQATVADLASRTAQRLGKPHTFAPADILVDDGYLGAGYGVVGDLERSAIRLMAQTEGILLDPVYTGRAFGGLLDILRRPERALLSGRHPLRAVAAATDQRWHLLGTPAVSPALFAYARELR